MAALGQAEADARVSTAVPPAEALREAVWAILPAKDANHTSLKEFRFVCPGQS